MPTLLIPPKYPELNNEVIIRGRIVEISAQIENCLKAIIYLATQNRVTLGEAQEIFVRYRGLRFYQKVENALKIIEEFYPALLKTATDIFKRAEDLLDYRNKIAHGSISWPDKTLNSFTVWDIADLDDNPDKQYHKPFTYTIDEHIKYVGEFKEVVLGVMDILERISEDIGAKFPDFFFLEDREHQTPESVRRTHE